MLQNDVEQPSVPRRVRDEGVDKGGRPPKLVESDELLKQIEGLARIQCTQREAAAVLGVHAETFAKFLDSHEKSRIAWEDGKETGKASLRREQFKSAQAGNTSMQIWLGKQWLGQKDQTETKTTLVSESTDEFLSARAAQLLGKAGISGGPGGDGAAEEAPQALGDVPGDGSATA